MSRRKIILLGVAAILIGPALYSLMRSPSAPESVLTLVSGTYRLDKIYHSMEGPWSIQKNITLATTGSSRPETVRTPQSAIRTSFVWLTGIDTEIVDAKSETHASPEFFCHANLTFADDDAKAGKKSQLDARLFTLAPGRTSIELPRGFGLPVPADARFDYLTMSLNLNPCAETRNIRMRTKLHAIAPDEASESMKPLFRRAVYVLQREDPSAPHAACAAKSANGAPDASEPSGLGCGEWMKVTLPNGSTALMPGQGMRNHWTVPQGDHVYISDVTPQLNLPFTTTIHYATIHVHPFARWMELRDLTTGQTVLHLTSRDWADRIGVAQVDEFKSADGIPIVRGHQYQLAVEYNNTSGNTTDALAILYLYLLDKQKTAEASFSSGGFSN